MGNIQIFLKHLLFVFCSVFLVLTFSNCCSKETLEQRGERMRYEHDSIQAVRLIQDSIRNEKIKPFDYKVSWKLRSLKFERQTETKLNGSFFLGCGSISTETDVHEEYYFYIETDRGTILKHIPVERVYIIECDTIEPCAVKVYKNVKFRYGVNKMFQQVKEGYYVYTGWDEKYFSSLESLNKAPIEAYLYYTDHGHTYFNQQSNHYIQLYVPVGTIISEYNGYQ